MSRYDRVARTITCAPELEAMKGEPRSSFSMFPELKTYLGEHITGLHQVPTYKIERQARMDAFNDLDTHGFAYAYKIATSYDLGTGKFDMDQLWAYQASYRQVVEGFFMAMP